MARCLSGCTGCANELGESWVIYGQSNAIGEAVWVGPWTVDPRVFYWRNGVLTQFAPNPTDMTHGIELSLGPTIADATGSRVMIGKAGLGGVSAIQLSSGPLWDQCVGSIKATVGQNGTPYHFAYIQGENEAAVFTPETTEAAYAATIRGIFANARAQFGADTRIHVLLLNINIAYVCPNIAAVRAAQVEVVATDGNAALIDADDMVPTIAISHYNTTQMQELGRRFAASG